MKKNCWEFMDCGRELGGKNAKELGICPAFESGDNNGINDGEHAGRSCWMRAGTFCKGEVQGEFSKKIFACLECAFFKQVMDEEGENFTLLAKGDEFKLILNFYEKLKESNTKITEQKALIDNASKLAALGEMAGGIAHEINNPLTIISGYSRVLTQMIKNGSTQKEQMLDLLNSIGGTVNRISKIVDGLKNVSRDGSRDLHKIELFEDVISDATSLCFEKFKNSSVNLDVTKVKKGIKIRCQRIQLSQVILNLLNNAYDAINELDEKWIKIEAEEKADNVFIRIIDCGEGIPESVRLKIKDPFYTTKRVGHGTGLGLSISNTIIANHQGTLEIDEKCSNTSFIITLPKLKKENKND